MRMSKNKHVVVSHGADLDGVASAILLTHYIQAKFSQTPQVLFANYDDVGDVLDEALKSSSHLWISDLSIRNLDLASKLAHFTPETLYFFDHHADTTQFVEEIQNIATVCFDSSGNKCAADLIWEYISSENIQSVESLEYLTKATRSRDLWINDVPEGASLSAVIAMLGPEKVYQHLMEGIYRVRRDKFSDLMEFCVHVAEDGINNAKNLAQASMIKYFYTPDSPKSCAAGLSVVAAFTTGCQSEVGDMFLTEIPRAMVGLINLETLTLSFRTTKDVIGQLGFGVNSIAQTIDGGGGHPYAAGAPLSKEILMHGPRALLELMLTVVDAKAFEKEGVKLPTTRVGLLIS